MRGVKAIVRVKVLLDAELGRMYMMYMMLRGMIMIYDMILMEDGSTKVMGLRVVNYMLIMKILMVRTEITVTEVTEAPGNLAIRVIWEVHVVLVACVTVASVASRFDLGDSLGKVRHLALYMPCMRGHLCEEAQEQQRRS
mmetsp:Transcript_54314/g.129788  ORF Transcript_54314/g.129788 Transcript_54314/m.129788 type:complete len:140 (-) Transcript_54314:86-505(-)